jgi:hypothetical protein
MPFQNCIVTEAELADVDLADFDAVRLVATSGSLGRELWQRYRVLERVGGKSGGARLWQRLLVCVPDPHDETTAARVRDALKLRGAASPH